MKKIYCLLFALCAILTPPLTSASVGLSVSPPVTEILLSPNKSVTTTIQLTSTGDETSYTLSLHKLIPTDEYGHSTIDPKPLDPTSIPLIITLVGAEWNEPYYVSTSKPNNITLRLEASSLDSPEDVYLAVLARPLPTSTLTQSSTTTPGIAALILTTITPFPAIPTDISLGEFTLPPLHDSSKPLTLQPTATNKSNIMLRVKGGLELKDPWGKVVQTSSLDPTLILGGTTRHFPPTIFSLKPSHLGPYTLTMSLTTEGGRELVRNSTVVWILPIRYLIITLVLLLLLTILKMRAYRLTLANHKD